jgi:hypothetical protein
MIIDRDIYLLTEGCDDDDNVFIYPWECKLYLDFESSYDGHNSQRD